MKPHRILKGFHGSQNGHDAHYFEAGTVRDLSDSLAEIVVREGWAKPHSAEIAAAEAARSVEAQGAGDQPGDQGEGTPDREEKSEGDAPANKMKKAAPENKGRK
jgi:hypothetical protein